MLYKILPVLTIFACTILSQLVVEGCKRMYVFVQKMYVFVCLYLFWVCIYFPTISFAFLGLPRLVMHPKQEIATLVLAAAWCCGFACICVFFMYFLLFFVCLLRTFFCQQRISQLATNARARGDRCAPQDPNMCLYTCTCTCFMYLREMFSKYWSVVGQLAKEQATTNGQQGRPNCFYWQLHLFAISLQKRCVRNSKTKQNIQ